MARVITHLGLPESLMYYVCGSGVIPDSIVFTLKPSASG